MCLRTVFSHKESVPVRNLLYPVKRKRLSIQMNANDAFGMLRNLLFDPVRINFPGICRTVHEYRRRSCIGNAPCCCNVRVGRNDDFIAGAYAQCQHGRLQGRCAVIYTGCRLYAAELCKLSVKLICILPTGKSSFLADLLNCLHIGILMFCKISREINSFQHIHSFRPFSALLYLLSETPF